MKLLTYKTATTDFGGERLDLSNLSGGMRDYMNVDVLEAAIERAKFLFTNFDNVLVAFSGGKDSLVVLELLDMVRIELGIKKKLTVFFWDEELLSDDHIKFMTEIYNSGRFDLHWVVAQYKTECYILGKTYPFIQWDITREHLRPIPEWAETFLDGDPCSEWTVFNKYFAHKYPNYVLCLGLRASESLNRLRSVLRTKTPERPYIVIPKVGQAESKIIYDWNTKDVFKFMHQFGIKYAPTYDAQTWGNSNLRVATPFTVEAAKALATLKGYDPVFYNRLITLFPEMIVQEKYYEHMNRDATYEKYGVSKEGIYQFINDTLSGRSLNKALRSVDNCFKIRDEDKESGRYPSRMPLLYIFQAVVNGSYKRYIVPLGVKQVTDKMMKYETPD